MLTHCGTLACLPPPAPVVPKIRAGGRAASCVHFQGADVILVPDNDDIGYSFINDVGAALAGTAKRIRVLRLPRLKHKGDASDWLEVGGTVEQWHELVEQAPDWVLRHYLDEILDKSCSMLRSWRPTSLRRLAREPRDSGS
jgi:hypothetical protein